jgi:5-methylcytosine-specific restriction endonuclease McrA
VCGNRDDLELDHIIAFAEGGADDLNNAQWLCRSHHREKTLAEAARGRQRAIARRGSLSKRYRDCEKHPGELA